MAKQYKVLAGTHAEGRTVYRKGDVFSSEMELDKVFGKTKFFLVGESDEPVMGTTPEPQAIVEENDEPGKNVASSFRGLKKYVDDGLVILEREGGFWIFDDDSKVNQEALKKSKVRAAVIDYFG